MAVLKCDICCISLCEHDITLHLKGKKHQKKIEQLQRLGRPIPEINLKDKQQGAVNVSSKKEPPLSKTSEADAKNVAQPPKKRPVKEIGKRKRGKDEHADPKCLVPSAIVDKTKTFEEQVNDFISQVQQTDYERMKINKVLFDVALTFSKVMPGVMPVLYGSQSTGLAYKTSDIDIYLCNPYARDEDVEFIKQHGRVIYKSRLFSDIIMITKARVPIIKATHIKTKIKLDISATSGQAVANSTLIYFLMSHDIRIRKLMMLIGYCVKKRDLISVSKFKIYSINLLIIFYLQTLKKPILPPLKKLLYGIPGKTWPFCVSHDVSLLHNDNNMSLNELFIGFFEFYKTFPFTTHLISTYYGDKISKKDLESSKILESMFYYKIYMIYTNDRINTNNVCIQDPFLLEFNTSVGVNPSTIDKFVRLCEDFIHMKTKYEVGDWMNEILNGEVAKPLLEAKPISTALNYPLSPDWIDKFKSDFLMSFTLLHIGGALQRIPINKINERNSDEENKQTKICFIYSLETSVSPFTPGNREIIDLLRKKKINLDEFSKKFKLETQEKSFKLSVYFTARSVKPGKINLLIDNNGDINSFQSFAGKYKSFIKLLLSIYSEKKHTSAKTLDSKKSKKISANSQSHDSRNKSTLKEKSVSEKDNKINAVLSLDPTAKAVESRNNSPLKEKLVFKKDNKIDSVLSLDPTAKPVESLNDSPLKEKLVFKKDNKKDSVLSLDPTAKPVESLNDSPVKEKPSFEKDNEIDAVLSLDPTVKPVEPRNDSSLKEKPSFEKDNDIDAVLSLCPTVKSFESRNESPLKEKPVFKKDNEVDAVLSLHPTEQSGESQNKSPLTETPVFEEDNATDAVNLLTGELVPILPSGESQDTSPSKEKPVSIS